MTQPEAMRTVEYLYGIDIVDGNDAWAMFCASADGDLVEISRLLEKDSRLVNSQYAYQFPLHLATWQNQVESVRLLLDRGADIGHSRWWYRSWDRLLPLAESRGFTEIATMLEATMESRFCYDSDFAAIAEAASVSDLNRVAALLNQAPAQVLAADAKGQNLVHLAVTTHDRRLVDLALDSGADINHRRADGMTPLLLAIHGDHLRRWTDSSAIRSWVMAGYLLSRGAEDELCVAAALGDEARAMDLLAAQPELATQLNAARHSPLFYAAKAGQTKIVKLLLDRGADPNSPEWNAETGAALHGASGENHLDVMELLLRRGANPNSELDSCGDCLTIVKHYHDGQHEKAHDLLRRYGARPAIYERSPADLIDELRRAATADELSFGAADYLSIILAHNEVESVDDCVRLSGQQLITSLTAETGFPRSRAMVDRLIKDGLNIRATDWCGQTLLHLAAKSNVPGDLLQALVDHGADHEARDLEFNATPREHAAMAGKLDNLKFLPD